MSWINSKSGLLIRTEEAKSFQQKNDLFLSSSQEGAMFFNSKVLIKIYEERDYVHADYYALQAQLFGRELQGEILTVKLPVLDDRKKLFVRFSATEDVLSGSSMQRFRFLLYVIDVYMQDFLKGDLSKVSQYMQPFTDDQVAEIKKVIKG